MDLSGLLMHLSQVSQVQNPFAPLAPAIDWSLVRSGFHAILSEIEEPEIAHVNFDDVVGDKEGNFINPLENARRYAKRLGTDLSSSPHGQFDEYVLL